MLDPHETQNLINRTWTVLSKIGYKNEHLKRGYRFDDAFNTQKKTKEIDLAAFAHAPLSYRSACFGVTVSDDNDKQEISNLLALGAPYIFVIKPSESIVNLWQIHSKEHFNLIRQISPDQLEAVIEDNKSVWSPEEILRAKLIGSVRSNVQLDFSDVGLMPVLESAVHSKLDNLLRDTLAISKEAYNRKKGTSELIPSDYKGLVRLVFRLIAAKLRGDRDANQEWLNDDVSTVIKAIENLYSMNSTQNPVLEDEEIQNLAWKTIKNAFLFQNLSVEALAYVYENTLVSSETRRELGTHATPYRIAEFMVNNLPFEDLDLDNCKIFEPFAGHAPFLITALSRLRTLLLPRNLEPFQQHEYFKHTLIGMEVDSFACEVAINSLILADYPNSNGWNIENADVFKSTTFYDYLAQAKVVLCNPPYEDFKLSVKKDNPKLRSANKAAEILNRVLTNPPEMLGFVLPASFFTRRSFDNAQQRLKSVYKRLDIVELPDNAFKHSDSPTVMLMAHNKKNTSRQIRWSKIDKPSFNRFAETGMLGWQDITPTVSDSINDIVFKPTPLQAIWEFLKDTPNLSNFVEIRKGLEHNLPLKFHRSELISDVPHPGFVKGLSKIEKQFEPLIINYSSYLNSDKKLQRDGWNWRWLEPKVIVNVSRLERGNWKIAALVDDEGLYCTRRFYGIWPQVGLPTEVIASIINNPVANAYISTHYNEREIQKNWLQEIPVPNFTLSQINTIVSLTRDYMKQRLQWLQEPKNLSLESKCRDLFWRIEAMVIDAYRLPPSFERQLLEYFGSSKRRGPIQLIPSDRLSSIKPHKTIIKIEGIQNGHVSLTVDGWDPDRVINVPRKNIPVNVLEQITENSLLFADVNIGAKNPEDLFIYNLEVAPELDPNDELA